MSRLETFLRVQHQISETFNKVSLFTGGFTSNKIGVYYKRGLHGYFRWFYSFTSNKNYLSFLTFKYKVKSWASHLNSMSSQEKDTSY